MSNTTELKYTLIGVPSTMLKGNSLQTYDHNLVREFIFDENLESLTLFLHEGIIYHENQVGINQVAHDLFSQLLVTNRDFMMTSKMNFKPQIKAPVFTNEDGVRIIGNEIENCLCISFNASATVQLRAENVYSKMNDKLTHYNRHKIKYHQLMAILRNDNLILRFMMLYEMLLKLLTPENTRPVQRYVVDYLRSQSDTYTFIQFKQTRLPGADHEEDDFTYRRNEIGHAEETEDFDQYVKLGNDITSAEIFQLVTVIADYLDEH